MTTPGPCPTCGDTGLIHGPGQNGNWTNNVCGCPAGDGDTAPDVARLLEHLHQQAANGDPWLAADATAKRSIVAEVMSWRHRYEGMDAYYSCAQAADPDPVPGEDGGPGSGCADEDRAGGPCDCGLDARRAAILAALAGLYNPKDPDTTR